jgi:hypothetical protein
MQNRDDELKAAVDDEGDNAVNLIRRVHTLDALPGLLDKNGCLILARTANTPIRICQGHGGICRFIITTVNPTAPAPAQTIIESRSGAMAAVLYWVHRLFAFLRSGSTRHRR